MTNHTVKDIPAFNKVRDLCKELRDVIAVPMREHAIKVREELRAEARRLRDEESALKTRLEGPSIPLDASAAPEAALAGVPSLAPVLARPSRVSTGEGIEEVPENFVEKISKCNPEDL